MVSLAADQSRQTLPSLPYNTADLAPHIGERTMVLHHDKHHAAYVTNLNEILKDQPDLQGRSALWLLLNLDAVPKKIRTAIRNNAGGHVNHSLFWRVMSPGGGGAPAGVLGAAIDHDFGSFEQFKMLFMESGRKHFGSGWVWLAREQQDGGRLKIYTTAGHDNPLMKGRYPILVNDLWEHAYYLDYENRRDDYLKSWWAVVNWNEVACRFERSDQFAVQDWEGEGGFVPGAT